jgi:uncharacterized protein YbjT (DUF2867 family)/uncharacterized membrane protein YphA (DoxX/SURF4 family)
MRILLTGAGGFIGAALVEALAQAGHELVLAARDPAKVRARWPQHAAIGVDFSRDHDPLVWRERLVGVEAIVNAVGLFREAGEQTFEAVHVRAPRALFEASAAAGVERVIQLSALGADDSAASAYHRSKKQADDALLALPLCATVVQPSLVFGVDGTSSRLFLRLASSPVLPLPAGGRQCVQPVHVQDLVAAIVALLWMHAPPARLAVVGPRPIFLRDYLQCLRRPLGLAPAPVLPVPLWLSRPFARLAGRLPRSLLDTDSLAMLERGNCADASAVTALLGRPPRDCTSFVDATDAPALREQTLLEPALSLLRLSIALVWIVTGLVSFGIWPVADSLQLLHRSGVPPALAPAALYGAATLDLLLGIGMLPHRHRRKVYWLQIGLVLVYTAVITLRLPEFWLHPYGPILKNLPLLAALVLLLRMERPRWNT